ncbi:MAG: Imm51 family immunity protein [Saprospiraceae bacterium]
MAKQYDFPPLMVYQMQYEDEMSFNIEIKTGAPGFEKAEELFRKYANIPDGEGWDGLVTYIIEKELTTLLDKFDLDYWGETFVVTCERKADMTTLATLLQSIIQDEAKLESYLMELPEEYKSE